MDTTRIPPAGDPFTSAPRRHRTTRHHRVDDAFLELLFEDFAIPMFALRCAFAGVPAEPKKSALAIAEWASRADDPARALLAWARKNGCGAFRPSEEADAGDDA